MSTCRDCGAEIFTQEEKALDGTNALVWADAAGVWVCPTTGDEHEPA